MQVWEPTIGARTFFLGTFVLNGATPVVVPCTFVQNIVAITIKTPGGTVGAAPVIQSIIPGVSFTVAGTAGDTSTYSFRTLA